MANLIFDISGVLIVDGNPLPGAVDTLNRLRADDIPLRFATNTSRKTRQAVHRELEAAGIDAAPEEIFTAPFAARRYLETHGLRARRLIHPDLEPDFADLPQAPANAVLVADAGENFDYAALNRAFRDLMDGAALIATGNNRYFQAGDGLSLDAGPFVRALEYAADTRAVVTGKPAAAFFAAIRASFPDPDAPTWMIGDDAASDIDGALNANLSAVLVQTGKFRDGDAERVPGAACCADVQAAVDHILGRR